MSEMAFPAVAREANEGWLSHVEPEGRSMVVEAVSCEPVSDSTTGINRANSRIQALFVITHEKLTLCAGRFCLKFPCKGAGNFSTGDGDFYGPSAKIIPMHAGVRPAANTLDRGGLRHRCGDAAVLQHPVLDFIVRKAYFDLA
jgi:hypothetical protein